eukprot:XP_001692221.1 predicted protein [Chlamydomonas reinhardtii]
MELDNPDLRYEVREVIGKGAFGEVNLVVEKTTRQRYVLKRIKMARQSEWQRKATRQEIEIVSRLRHPFIMPYKEHWTHHGHTINVVYGYCEKGDLTTAVTKQKGTRNDYALVGTPHFMSPELLSNAKYSFETDIWSLGVVMYELTTLKPPFNAFNLAGLVAKIKRAALPPIPAGYSADWAGVLKRYEASEMSQPGGALDCVESADVGAAAAVGVADSLADAADCGDATPGSGSSTVASSPVPHRASGGTLEAAARRAAASRLASAGPSAAVEGPLGAAGVTHSPGASAASSGDATSNLRPGGIRAGRPGRAAVQEVAWQSAAARV